MLKTLKAILKRDKYGRVALLKRNEIIVDSSDIVIAFRNGKSRETKYVIDYCHKKHKNLRVYICNK